MENKNEKNHIENLLKAWENSTPRKTMFEGEKYYRGEQAILNKKRTTFDAEGGERELRNLINSKIIDNQYSKLVDQKVNYLVGKPITFKCDNEEYLKKLKTVFDKSFHRKFKYITENALNTGIGWLYPYYDENGEFKIRRFDSTEILPVYKSKDKEELEMVIRLYKELVLGTSQVLEKVEVYKRDGVDRYIRKQSILTTEILNIPYVTYAGEEEQGYNWEKLPFIPFRYNQQEIPLIARVKSIQDAINEILSTFHDNMAEDSRKTLLVLVNYDGSSLEEFVNMKEMGVIKVSTVDGTQGDVKALQLKVDTNNYKTALEVLKRALIENGRGFDAKDERMGANPNQMNIQSMYADIDLDANNMETEFQAALEQLIWFVNVHLGMGEDVDLQVIFDRDVLVNETQTIENIQKSIGILSSETLISQHPYIDDPKKEIERVKKEKEERIDQYNNAFPNTGSGMNGQEE